VKGFRSDNNAGLCAEAVQAILDANDGHCFAYGDDPYTQAAVAELRRIFGPGTAAWFVATGTAANTLAIASLTQPWQRVLCHEHSHYNDDESTAPERITHCRIVQIRAPSGKIGPRDIQQAGQVRGGDVHEPQPGVVTLSNSTEFGLVSLGYQLKFPTQANAVFVELSPSIDAALRDRGYAWYPFGDPQWNMFRAMCSFDTRPEQVDALLADAGAIVAR